MKADKSGNSLDNAKKQMRKGILEMCIMSIISQEEAYPSDIIEKLAGTGLIVKEGTIYPLLTRLKGHGLLSYTFKESTSGPPRKYYQMTVEGSAFLKELTHTWNQLVKAVNQTTINLSEYE